MISTTRWVCRLLPEALNVLLLRRFGASSMMLWLYRLPEALSWLVGIHWPFAVVEGSGILALARGASGWVHGGMVNGSR
eukprot:CAMPEP_0183513920 /NCGR_PEP_ID=MMETSP0371-20130417/12531_1 /TAXON_ID=268820 /ORGANISM="Peridinium aciculiferum, Strain PAER-2" /LENGTH=78 /DNA_ID=CAMNT_0025711239 /DNA_START=41 /DNA_END=274 /DNA_ORIENTATION=+